MKELFMIGVGAALINNVVLSQFLGICAFLGVSRKTGTAAGMGAAVIFVITLSSLITGILYRCVLVPLHVEYLQTIVFILIIAALVQFVEMALKKYSHALYEALGVYLPLITTNCAVLGCTLLNIENHYGFVESLINALGSGLGFMLAMVLFAGVRSKMETVEFPKSFQGIPITLIAASIVSMSFMGFASVADGIFK